MVYISIYIKKCLCPSCCATSDPAWKLASYNRPTCPEHETHRFINSGVGLDCVIACLGLILKNRCIGPGAQASPPGGQLTTTMNFVIFFLSKPNFRYYSFGFTASTVASSCLRFQPISHYSHQILNRWWRKLHLLHESASGQE